MDIRTFSGDLEQIECSRASGGKIDEIKPDRWIDNNNWVAQTKLDGTRLKMHITSEGNRFDTRRISTQTNLYMERTNNFPHLRDLNLQELEGTIFDGECVAPVDTDTFKNTQSIVGSLPERAIEKQAEIGLMKYYIFDVIRFKGEDVTNLSYVERLHLIEESMNIIEKEQGINSWINTLELIPTDKLKLYKTLIHNGEEGIMLKDLNAIYYDNHFMEKVKKSQRWTMIIKGFKHGNGKYKDVVGSIEVGFYDTDLTVYAGGLSELHRFRAKSNPEEYLGKVVEVEAQELTEAGSLRHPRFIDFRIDKTPEDCIIKQNCIIA